MNKVSTIKQIAILGAGKESLNLLPLLVESDNCNVALIVDSNTDAMLFKLDEMGYSLSPALQIEISTNLHTLRDVKPLDIIIDTIQDWSTDKLLSSSSFKDIEIMHPLSARLVWGAKSSSQHKREEGDKTDLGFHNEHSALLSSFRDIVDSVNLVSDREELFTVAMKLAMESTGADRCSIMLKSVDEEGKEHLTIEASRGIDDEIVRRVRVPVGVGVAGKVAKDGKPSLVKGRTPSGDFNLAIERFGVKNSISVPLISKGNIIGVLNVSSSRLENTLTREDQSYLSSLGILMADIILVSNQYEEFKSSASKYAFCKELDMLFESDKTLEERLQSICKKLSSAIDGLTSKVYVYDEDNKNLHLRATCFEGGEEDLSGDTVVIAEGTGIEGEAIQNGKRIIMEERGAEDDKRRSFIVHPVYYNDIPQGVLTCQVVSENGISKSEETFISDISTITGECIFKSKLHKRSNDNETAIRKASEMVIDLFAEDGGKELLSQFTEGCADVLGAERAILRLRKGGGNKFSLASHFSQLWPRDEDDEEDFIPHEMDSVRHAVRSGNTVRHILSHTPDDDVRSLITKELKIGSYTIGTITCMNKLGDTNCEGFSKDDEKVVERITTLGARLLAEKVPVLMKGVPDEERSKLRKKSKLRARAGSIEITPEITSKVASEITPGEEVKRVTTPAEGEAAEGDTTVPIDEAIRSIDEGIGAAVTVSPSVLLGTEEEKSKPLSGFYSMARFDFSVRVNEELNRSRRSNSSFVLASIRLEGDFSGDEMVGVEEDIGRYIKRSLRNFDFIVKLDEFTIGILFLDTDKSIRLKFETLLDSLSEGDPLYKVFLSGKVRLKYGIAGFPDDGDSFDELYLKACDMKESKLIKSVANRDILKVL